MPAIVYVLEGLGALEPVASPKSHEYVSEPEGVEVLVKLSALPAQTELATLNDAAGLPILTKSFCPMVSVQPKLLIAT